MHVTDDRMCWGTLICNNATTNCNCPTSVGSLKCDCPRTKGNEYYWNSTSNSCELAKAYGQSCSQNYHCRTTTEKTSCISGTCSCASGGFSASLSKCAICPSGWSLNSDRCYYVTPTTISSKCSYSGYLSCCTNEALSRLVSTMYNSTVKSFIDSITHNNPFWVSAYRSGSTWYWTGTTISIPNSAFDSGTPDPDPSKSCLTYDKAIGRYKNDACSNSAYAICEVDLN